MSPTKSQQDVCPNTGFIVLQILVTISEESGFSVLLHFDDLRLVASSGRSLSLADSLP